jgi:hypothetical protein
MGGRVVADRMVGWQLIFAEQERKALPTIECGKSLGVCNTEASGNL